ncbi:MAG TPA: acetylglutamate kinase [Deltaproteobacteria bacterium]|nr:acetylglutamate kinase [Deltaproteobacteria bacterium]HHZ77717.1 acetylglutamate kinase [Candidatus Lambdaproteobacteria bacterium]HIN47472.1 acetylglutamate kinase [Deltaproteobacteria bacterium]HIO61552.1 acetylglutamate kinase [Deltaproteobacteria bacterium]
MSMFTEENKNILIEALSYIKRFNGKIVVIKYGGAAMIDEKLKHSFAQDIVLLQSLGMLPVIVHGGGPEVSKAMERLGQKVSFIDGLRVTSSENLKVAEMVLSGTINKEIITHLNTFGGKAVGVSGKDGLLIEARKKQHDGGVDLGYVGEIESVNPELLLVLLKQGFLPVVSPIGLGKDGTTYNINADTTASRIAVSLHAYKIIFMTDVDGVLVHGKLRGQLSANEAENLIKQNVISGGMAPKIDAGLYCINNGVESAQIINGTDTHSVIAELFTDQGIGTKIVL